MTLTKALTHTVDSEFNDLSIKLSHSCFFDELKFSINKLSRTSSIKDLQVQTFDEIEVAESLCLFKLVELYDRIPRVLFCQVIPSITFITLDIQELISSDSCQDKTFQYQSTRRRLSIAVRCSLKWEQFVSCSYRGNTVMLSMCNLHYK